MFRKTLIATLLASAGLSALAVDYYVVAPLPGKQHLVDGISVALNTTPLPTGVVGVPYAGFNLSSALQVTGDPAFNATNIGWSVVAGALPAGLALTKGVISGTPTAIGEQTFSVRATYKTKTGEQAYKILTFAVSVALATGTLPQGVAGVAYPTYDLKTLLVVQGDPSFNPANVVWTVVSNTLPAGLTLKADGTISGTPTVSGTGAVTARASYKGVNGEKTYQVVTLGITVSLATATLPQGVQGTAYSYDLKPQLAVAGDPGYAGAGVTWELAGGTLPAGLSLNASTGIITGTPSAEGTSNFSARAAYRTKTGEQAYQVVVGALTVSLAAGALPAATLSQAYNFDLKTKLTVSGDGAYVPGAGVAWSVASGTLPAGLSLGASGVVSGTPTTASTKTFTAQAVYKTKVGQQSYSLEVPRHNIVLQAGGYRTWADGTVATSCNAYLQGATNYAYAGAMGDGVYRIQPVGTTAINAYCDMTTNGGGYTVVLAVRDFRYHPTGPGTVATDSSPAIPGQSHSSYLPRGIAVALAQASSEIRIQEVGTSKAIWTSNATVMANLRAGYIANYTATQVTDTTADWQQSYAGVAQFNTTCETLRTPAVADSEYPSIFWACGNQTGLHINIVSYASWMHSTANGAMTVSYR